MLAHSTIWSTWTNCKCLKNSWSQHSLSLKREQLRSLMLRLPFPLFDLMTSDLRHCELGDLEPVVFDPLTNLKTLWLDDNQLQEIPSHLFAKLVNMKTLWDLNLIQLHPNSLLSSELHLFNSTNSWSLFNCICHYSLSLICQSKALANQQL